MDIKKYFDQARPVLELFFRGLLDEATYDLIEVGKQDLAEGLVNGLIIVTNRLLNCERITNLILNKTEFERRGIREKILFGFRGDYSTDALNYKDLETEVQPLISEEIPGLPKALVNFRVYNGAINLGDLEREIDFNSKEIPVRFGLEYWVGYNLQFLSANLRLIKAQKKGDKK